MKLKVFSTLLRFARSEQMGLALLFVLVLAVIVVPRLMLPPEPPPFAFEALQRRIDSSVAETIHAPVAVPTQRKVYAPPAAVAPPAVVADTQSKRIDYKPYVRVEPALPVVDLNRADTLQLQEVRGIGSYYARRIAEYRERLGGYADIGQLLEIRGITEEQVLRWQSTLKVDLSAVRKIALQTATEAELRKHPYIGYYAARGIMNFRKTAAAVTLGELVRNNVLDQDAASRLGAYVE